MRVLRVYADTSVFGGPFDEEFAKASRAFFGSVERGEFSLVTSALVEQEVSGAPPDVQAFFAEETARAETVDVTDDAVALRDGYVETGIVPRAGLTDALHVAVATVAECDLIVSWNFKHIVNFRRIRQYNAVNSLRGYNEISIHSPLEVVNNDNEDI